MAKKKKKAIRDPKAWVSRAIYQKLAEENKAMKRDLYTICHKNPHGLIFHKLTVIRKWRDAFAKDEAFWELIRMSIVGMRASEAGAKLRDEIDKKALDMLDPPADQSDSK